MIRDDPEDCRPPGLLLDEFARDDIGRRLCAFIDYWFYESLYGSPLAERADLWNAVHCAVEDLKARIVTQI